MLYGSVKSLAPEKRPNIPQRARRASAAGIHVYFSDATGSELRSKRGVPA